MNLKYGPYSPSRLETAVCPYSFYRQYVDENKVRRTEGAAQARGSIVHEIFEVLTERMKSHPGKVCEVSNAEINTMISDSLSRHPAAMSEVQDIKSMIEKYLEKPPRILMSDASLEMRLAVKMTEAGWVQADYDDPEAFVRGRADIFMVSDDTTTGYLYDHKTQPNKEEADTFQLGVYAWVISKIYPFLDEIRTILHFARYGHYSNHVVWVKNEEIREAVIAGGDIDPNFVVNLASVEDELMTRIHAIENIASWDALPHKGCQYCPVVKECPQFKEMFGFDEEGRLTVKDPFAIMGDTNRAVKVAGHLTVIEAFEKKLKEDLREHVKNSSPVAIPGKLYCFKTEEVIDWDASNKRLKNRLYDVFEKYGIDPKEYMGFSQTFSKSLPFHKDENFVKDVLELLPRKISSEFRGVKI